MSNHITTEIHAAPEVLASLLREDDGRQVVDFNLIIPLPADDDPRITAKKTVFPSGGVGWSSNGVNPMDFARNWWGTKWNACSQENDAQRLRFDTAWSHPAPIIAALSARHPEQPIEVKYADEDLGSNLGHYVITGGVIEERAIEDGNEFAAQLRYGQTYAEYSADW